VHVFHLFQQKCALPLMSSEPDFWGGEPGWHLDIPCFRNNPVAGRDRAIVVYGRNMSETGPVASRRLGPDDRPVDADLDALYRTHFTELVAHVRAAFGSGPPEPEDAVQTAFMKFARLQDRSGVANPRNFIFISAQNIIFDHRRMAKTANAYIAEQLALDSELALEQITPERVVVARERFSILTAAMRRLPQKQQVLLAMSRLEGKTYREIAAETGYSLADVSRNINQAITALVIALKRDRLQSRRPGARNE
jgi:RNA polymerase sigma factor (sigma-70 family)